MSKGANVGVGVVNLAITALCLRIREGRRIGMMVGCGEHFVERRDDVAIGRAMGLIPFANLGVGIARVGRGPFLFRFVIFISAAHADRILRQAPCGRRAVGREGFAFA